MDDEVIRSKHPASGAERIEVVRSEDLAARQVLPISVGGERIELRTLSIEESDAWLRTLTGAVDIDVGAIGGDADGLAKLLSLSAQAALDVIAAYDADGVLGGREALSARMTKREVRIALEAMATAEDPFAEGALRLVDEVFGAPSRLLAAMSTMVTSELASRPGASPSGASLPGASTTGPRSDLAGAASGSSSSGPTGTSASGTRRRRSATPSPTG
jgi:hypothetical protein